MNNICSTPVYASPCSDRRLTPHNLSYCWHPWCVLCCVVAGFVLAEWWV